MERVTLKDIAERAGVSVATVSLALRGRRDVARETVARVRSLAEEMGYRPDPVLSALAAKRFSEAESRKGTSIAVLECSLLPDGGGSAGESYRQALLAEAIRMGYAPTRYTIGPHTQPAALHHELYHRNTPGLILVGSISPSWLDGDFEWSDFSVVQCARYATSVPFHTVRPNIFQAVKLVFNQLRARGYERIGFGMGRHASIIEDDEDRYGTATALIEEHLPRKNRVPIYLDLHSHYESFIAWVKKYRPDAVVGFTAGHHWSLEQAGYAIPEDIGFASLHLVGPNSQNMAGLYQSSEEIGRQSVLLLDQLIRGNERGTVAYPMDLLIPSRWQEGATLRPLVRSESVRKV